MNEFVVNELDVEVLDAVQTLNNRFMDGGMSEEHLPFSVSIDGFSTLVKYWGIKIWCDSDDDRDYNDCTDNMMPIRDHLIAKTKELAPIFQFNFDEPKKGDVTVEDCMSALRAVAIPCGIGTTKTGFTKRIVFDVMNNAYEVFAEGKHVTGGQAIEEILEEYNEL